MPIEKASAARLRIDLNALASNYALLSARAAPGECAAVVKADAYGLGVVPVVQRLLREGCGRFFVATVAEAAEVRVVAPQASIYVLEGAVAGTAGELSRWNAIPVLNSLEQIMLWRGRGRAAVHVDTGMARLGLSAADVARLSAEPDAFAGITVEFVATHLACADEPEHELNREQLARFERLRAQLPSALTSIGNSAGDLLGGRHRGDIVRVGLGLYGGNPFGAGAQPLAPVVEFTAPILQIREIDETQTVGYGATYVVRPPARLAIVGAGYADGYPRRLGNRAMAAIRGRRVPVVGRVSMDLLCVDISALPRDAVSVGDAVELIGPTVPLEEVAAAADTISYEILTGLGRRLIRDYIGA